jgi:hypothetical protein
LGAGKSPRYLRDEVLDLELIEQLVELALIDAGAKTARVGLEHVPGLCILACRRGQAAPDYLVQRLLEGQSATTSERLELLGQIGLEGDGRPHRGSMMPHEMLASCPAEGASARPSADAGTSCLPIAS